GHHGTAAGGDAASATFGSDSFCASWHSRTRHGLGRDLLSGATGRTTRAAGGFAPERTIAAGTIPTLAQLCRPGAYGGRACDDPRHLEGLVSGGSCPVFAGPDRRRGARRLCAGAAAHHAAAVQAGRMAARTGPRHGRQAGVATAP